MRVELKALGGIWDGGKKAWIVPDNKADVAKNLVANQSAPAPKKLGKNDYLAIAARKRGETPGVCSSCGGKCKYPYTECWDCKEERDMGY